jgi:hypothetical protein
MLRRVLPSSQESDSRFEKAAAGHRARRSTEDTCHPIKRKRGPRLAGSSRGTVATPCSRYLRGCLGSPEKRAKMRVWDTRATSATRNGGSLDVCCRHRSPEVGHAQQSSERWSTPSSTSCVAAALGACSPVTFPRTRRFICTSGSGRKTGPGRGSMTLFETAYELATGGRRAPAQQSSTVRA